MTESSVSNMKNPTIIYLVGIIIAVLVSSFLYGFRHFGAAPDQNLLQKMGDVFIFFGTPLLLIIILIISRIWNFIGGIISILLGLIICTIPIVSLIVVLMVFMLPVGGLIIYAGIQFIKLDTKHDFF